MAKIPEYQGQSLASSQVGTPGVDPSAGQVAQGISQVAGQFANTTYDIAVKRKAAMDSAVSNKSVLGLDVDMENAYQNHQQTMKDFQGEPKQRAAIFQAQAEKMVQDRAKSAPNDAVKRSILDEGMKMVQSRTNRELAAADKNQGGIAYAQIMDAQKMSADEAARIGGDDTLSFGDKINRANDLLVRTSDTVAKSSLVLGPIQTEKFKTEAPAATMRALATGMLATHPEQLAALLDPKDGQGNSLPSPFEGRLPPEEIAKFRKLTSESILNFEERRKVNDISAHLNQVSQAVELDKGGDHIGALAMTEQLPDGKLKDSMRQSILKEGITEADRTDKVYDLMTKFSTLSTDLEQHTTGRGAKKKTNMSASLQDLVDFQGEVIEAHATGDITTDTKNKYLTTFLPELQRQATAGKQPLPIATPFIVRFLVKAWRGITQVAPDKADAINIHEDFQKKLDQSKDYTPSGVNKALISALDEHRTNRFPKSLFLEGSVNGVLDHTKSLIQTGVQGQTSAPVSGKIVKAVTFKIGSDKDGNKFKITYDANGNAIKREPVPK